MSYLSEYARTVVRKVGSAARGDLGNQGNDRVKRDLIASLLNSSDM